MFTFIQSLLENIDEFANIVSYSNILRKIVEDIDLINSNENKEIHEQYDILLLSFLQKNWDAKSVKTKDLTPILRNYFQLNPLYFSKTINFVSKINNELLDKESRKIIYNDTYPTLNRV